MLNLLPMKVCDYGVGQQGPPQQEHTEVDDLPHHCPSSLSSRSGLQRNCHTYIMHDDSIDTCNFTYQEANLTG